MMDAAPPPPVPAAYVQEIGFDRWANCALGFEALQRRLKEIGRGRTARTPRDGAPRDQGEFIQYGLYLVTKPSNPLYPAVLMRAFKSPDSPELVMVFGGCGYGDPERFKAFLRNEGWDDSEIESKPVTGAAWPDGEAYKRAPDGAWPTFGDIKPQTTEDSRP